MAYFAKINKDNIVEQVIVSDEYFSAKEDGVWIETDKKNNYAGIGYTYDSVRKAFISPKPFETWVLNEENKWEAPVSKPELENDDICTWDEDNQKWNIINLNN